MKFTIPGATSSQQAFDIYVGVRKFIISKGYRPFFAAISSLEYIHNGNKEIATVNDITKINDEKVVLIFECEKLFLICTSSRGVTGGEPIIIGRNELIQVTYFEDIPEE
jgi:hypothetical protein